MKLDSSFSSEGIFQIQAVKYPGTISIKDNDFARVSLTTTKPFSSLLGNKDIGTIYGAINHTNKLITLYNCVLYTRSFSSYSIYQYEIVSNIVVFNANEVEFSLFNTANLTLGIKGLNKWIFKRLVDYEPDFDNSTAIMNIKNKEIETFPNHPGSVVKSINTFITAPFVFMHDKPFQIEQVTFITFQFLEVKSFDEVITFINTITNMFSFVFQSSTYVDEIVYHVEVENKGIKNKEQRSIWFSRKNCSYKEFEIDETMFSFYSVRNDFPTVVMNWLDLTNNIPYLDSFFIDILSTTFLDQKVISCINFLEAIHRFAIGDSVVPIQKHLDWVKNIIDQIINPDDKNRVGNILQDKNGFGLKAKLSNLCLLVKTSENKKIIANLVKYRGMYAHGSSTKNWTYDELKEMYNYSIEIINKYLMKEIANSSIKKGLIMYMIDILRTRT